MREDPLVSDKLSAAPLNLAEQRRRKGIDLSFIAAETKIDIRYLEAIEAEEFQKLPGGIFNTSYIRQYADFTSIDEVSILDRYLNFIDSADVRSLSPEIGVSEPSRDCLVRNLKRWKKFFTAREGP